MSKDLVGDGLADMEQRREDAWKAMKRMHDEANGIFELTASQGWCAPSSVIYGPSWQPGAYVPLVQTARGGIRFP